MIKKLLFILLFLPSIVCAFPNLQDIKYYPNLYQQNKPDLYVDYSSNTYSQTSSTANYSLNSGTLQGLTTSQLISAATSYAPDLSGYFLKAGSQTISGTNVFTSSNTFGLINTSSITADQIHLTTSGLNPVSGYQIETYLNSNGFGIGRKASGKFPLTEIGYGLGFFDTFNGTTYSPLFVGSYNSTPSTDFGTLTLYADATAAANVGPSISFGGRYNSSGNTQYITPFYTIKGAKENAFNTQTNGSLQFWGNNGISIGEVARFNSSGSLGIGTTSPTSKLDVNGTINYLNNLQVASNQTGYIKNGTGGTSIQINTGGNVGINSAANANTLDVGGNISSTATYCSGESYLTAIDWTDGTQSTTAPNMANYLTTAIASSTYITQVSSAALIYTATNYDLNMLNSTNTWTAPQTYISSTTFRSSVLESMLNPSYKLNDTTLNSYANLSKTNSVNNFTLSNTILQPGTTGSSLSFVGSGNGKLSIPMTSNYNFSGAFSVEMWAYTNSVTANQVMLMWYGGTGNNGFILGKVPTTNKWYAEPLNNGSNHEYDSDAIASSGTWTHLVFTRDSSNKGSLYVNNVAQSDHAVFAGTVYAANNNFYIGLGTGGNLSFNGYIDDVRLYNYCLTTSSISYHYNSGSGYQGSQESGLVGAWRFDEGTGTLAYDYSVNLNTGTLSGAALPTWGTGKVQTLINTQTNILTSDDNGINLDGNIRVSNVPPYNTTIVNPITISSASTFNSNVTFNSPIITNSITASSVTSTGDIYAPNAHITYGIDMATITVGGATGLTVNQYGKFGIGAVNPYSTWGMAVTGSYPLTLLDGSNNQVIGWYGAAPLEGEVFNTGSIYGYNTDLSFRDGVHNTTTDIMTIKCNGTSRVGINTISPAYTLVDNGYFVSTGTWVQGSVSDPRASLVVTGSATVSGMLRQGSFWHIVYGTTSVSVPIPLTKNVWAQISNATSNLIQPLENNGFIVSGDSITILNKADYKGYFHVSCEGSSSDNMLLRCYNVTQGMDTLGLPIPQTLTGLTNWCTIPFNVYVRANAGDVIIFQIENTSNNNNITVGGISGRLEYEHD